MSKQKGLDLGLTLREGETIEYSEHAWNGPIWAHIFLTVCTLGLWLLYAIPAFIIHRRRRLTITSQRIIAVHGLIVRRQQAFERSKVQHINVVQGPMANVCDYGDISIETAGATVPFVFERMDNPRAARDLAVA